MSATPRSLRPGCRGASVMAERCNHPRGIPEDLMGRGLWLCEKPKGHRGEHVAFKGSDFCRCGDDGFLPDEGGAS